MTDKDDGFGAHLCQGRRQQSSVMTRAPGDRWGGDDPKPGRSKATDATPRSASSLAQTAKSRPVAPTVQKDHPNRAVTICFAEEISVAVGS